MTLTNAARTADLELAKRCCAGDASAQRDLFHREKRRVHATLYRVLGSNAEIDDLVQEAFLEIFRGLRTFRGEAALATWVNRVVVRVAYGHIAKRKPAAISLAVVRDIASTDATAEQRAITREAARRLYSVLERVENRQRIAFLLHVIEGWPVAEVASAMEATEVATRVRVWRARRVVGEAARRDPLLAEFVGGES